MRGRRFEQNLTLQIKVQLDYGRIDLALSFWRTNRGQEVDLLLSRGDQVVAALEIKSKPRIEPGDLNGLHTFRTDYPQARALVVLGRTAAMGGGNLVGSRAVFFSDA